MTKSRAATERCKLWPSLAALVMLLYLPFGHSQTQNSALLNGTNFPANSGAAFDISPSKLTDTPAIKSALAGGTAKVIVALVPPSVAIGKKDFSSKAFLNSLQPEIKRTQQIVIDAIPARDVRVEHRFENIAGFSAEVTPDGLKALQANPRVAFIEPVYMLQAHLAQGIPLIHASSVRSNYSGAGVAIAICDTGVDYNHSLLGGGGFPNSKVIGGYNFGDGNADPIPDMNAHGTACAGIAAGDLAFTNDYIGGVAHDSKIYALKISSGSGGTASTAAIAAAWDWCVSHKNDDPSNPILIINTSFGGGRFFSTCDDASPMLTMSANNAVAAGITIFASSGNDGYCDSIGRPACISSVIAVAAVYDSNFGNLFPCISVDSCAPKTANGGCPTGYYATDSTAPDKVASYSNVGAMLGLFAPADKCSTLDISDADGYSSGDFADSFGGTSAACPYAAGAAACLQQAAKAITGSYLSPQQIRNLLVNNGDPVADTKAPVTKPRVNLERAVQNLSTNPILSFASSVVSGGNGNLNLDTNECANVTIFIRNEGYRGATNIMAVLSSTTPGVNVLQSNSVYPNISAGATASNSTVFTISTSPSFICGTLPDLKLVLIYDGGAATNSFKLGPGEYAIKSDGATIVPGTTDTGNHGDDTLSSVSLPFGFTFYDQTFSNAVLSANGNIQFRTSDGSADNLCLPDNEFNYAILPFWDDLQTSSPTGGIFTSLSGSAPNRIFNIEWRANYFGGGDFVNFEVRLYESRSRFDVIYGEMNGNGSTATIGAQRDTGSSFIQAGCNESIVTNGLRLVFQPSCVNGGGQCGAPFLNFVGGPTNGVLPLTVNFTNFSVAATNFVWNFGDGQTSTNVNPSHVYTNAGSYTVSLSAHNAVATNWFSRLDYIVVTNPPSIVNFAGGPTNGVAPLTVCFTNLSVFATNYVWDFGDGNQSTDTNPCEMFVNPGTYSITLIAIGTGGTNSLALTNYITVLVPPLLVVTPDNLDFDLVPTGAIAQASFVVSNAGEATLHGSATVSGAPFALLNSSSNPVSTLTVTLPGSLSTNVTVRFAPAVPNAFTNAVIFLSDGGNSTNLISGRSVGTLFMTQPMVNGTNFIFSFNTVSGVSYSVEYKDDLMDSFWQPLQIVNGDGSAVSITNSIPEATQRFFHVIAQ
jgi:PKD repeat protein/subtilisin family serine protease